MKKENSSNIITTTTRRKGDTVVIENITGNITIVGQKKKRTTSIEVTGDAFIHDNLKIKGAKGEIKISGNKGVETLGHCDLYISVPSGTSLKLENIGGTVVVNETVETLTVIGDRPCQVSANTLHGTILEIGTGVEVKIGQLIGRCDIVAREDAKCEVQNAIISTLSVKMRGNARVNMYGSAHLARISLDRRAYFCIDTIEEFLGRRWNGKSTTLRFNRKTA